MYKRYKERLSAAMRDYHCVFCTDRDNSTIIEPSEKICRFCGKKEPEVTFNKIAHAIPEMLGNKQYISLSECDTCNKKFSKYEDNLEGYLSISRSLMGLDGKQGIPNFDGSGIKIRHDNGNTIVSASDKNFNVNNKNGTIILSENAKYIPFSVYRILVKIALSLIPFRYLKDFGPTIKWLLNPKDNNEYWKQYADHTYKAQPVSAKGTMRLEPYVAIYIRNNQGADSVLYCVMQITYGSILHQIYIPSPEKDRIIKKSEVKSYLVPSPFEPYITACQKENLSSIEKVTQEGRVTLKGVIEMEISNLDKSVLFAIRNSKDFHECDTEIDDIFIDFYNDMLKIDLIKGGCHFLSSILHILLSEAGIHNELCLGNVRKDGQVFSHSWVEINQRIFDIAISDTNNPILNNLGIIFNNIDSYTYEITSIEYGILSESELVDQTGKKVERMTIGKYFMSCPYGKNFVWEYIIDFYKKRKRFLNIGRLKEKYSEENWIRK